MKQLRNFMSWEMHGDVIFEEEDDGVERSKVQSDTI